MEQQISILIVEDNLSYALEVQMMLEELGYLVLGHTETGEQALKIAKAQKPDVMILDIDLKGKLSGTDVGKQVKSLDIPVIYLTSHLTEAHYNEAKASHLTAFLEKPVRKFTLNAAVEAAMRTYAKNEEEDFFTKNYLFFKKKNLYHKIFLEEIAYIESLGNYCQIYIENQQHFLARMSLAKLETYLPSERFLRVHRQYIIQLNKIETVDLVNNKLSILETEIPISRNNKKTLTSRMRRVD